MTSMISGLGDAVVLLVLIKGAGLQAQSPTKRVPKFSDFHVAERFTGTPAEVDFESDPKGREFKTRLSKGLKLGPNFAGEYTIVRWGCGSPCGLGAILHTPTGRICAWFSSCGDESFKLDSRLLVLDPEASSDPDNHLFKTRYLLWDGNSLTEIHGASRAK